jgi:hypothetical protein
MSFNDQIKWAELTGLVEVLFESLGEKDQRGPEFIKMYRKMMKEGLQKNGWKQ